VVTTAPSLAAETQAFLKAIASPTRQSVLMLFAHGAELSVNDVAARARMGQSTASEQLALLRAGGALHSRREGRATYYRADRDGISRALAEIQAYVQSCC
jgi:DNA-binding transcriptional ArsR family regulator